MAIPTEEPTEIFAGDTLMWTKSLDDYSPSDWILHYSLRNEEQSYAFDAATEADHFKVTVASTDTTNWSPGVYSLVAYVTNDTERHVIASYRLVVKPDLAAEGPYDSRSHNRKVYDNILAILEGRDDAVRMILAGRQTDLMTIDELIKWKQYYADLVAGEEGKGPNRYVAAFS